MVALDPSTVLPVELLLAVFDFFSVIELARFRRVNKRWRDAVTAHPRYWRFPRLCGSSDSEIAFFLSRLTAARGKPLGIFVNQLDLFPALQTTVFPALGPHIPNIEHLQLRLHIIHAPAVFDILREPTHSLRYLELDFRAVKGTEAACPSATMPSDILSKGQLETLILRNVNVPESAPLSFASIRFLVFGHNVKIATTTLHDLVTACPHARHLTLTDRSVPFDPADWPPAWQFLDSLSLMANPLRLRAAVSRLPLARISRLTVPGACPATFARLLAHLDGPLNLSCRPKSGGLGYYDLHIHSWTTERVRSFCSIRHGEAQTPSVPHGILDSPQLAPRLRSLDIAASLWSALVPFIPELVDLYALTVVLDPVDGLAPLRAAGAGMLLCPVLMELHLCSVTRSHAVSSDDVRILILERIRPPWASVSVLVLEGVALPRDDRVALEADRLVDWIHDAVL